MQVTVLAFIGLGAAFVVLLVNSIQQRLRYRRMARELNCKPILKTMSHDPSGIIPAIRGARASAEKRFPDFVDEQFTQLCERHGRVVGTIQIPTPLFTNTIFTIEPQNIQTMLALKFKDFGLGINRTINFRPLLGNGIVSGFFKHQ